MKSLVTKILLLLGVLLLAVNCSKQQMPTNDKTKKTDFNNTRSTDDGEESPFGLERLSEEEENALTEYDTPITRSSLPSKLDYSNAMPPVGNQNPYGSCVGWAVSAVRTYQEKKELNWTSDNPAQLLSPSWVWQQLNGGRNKGITVTSALSLISNKGQDTVLGFPYDHTNYTKKPDQESFQRATRFKADEMNIWGFRLKKSVSNFKHYLNNYGPFIISLDVYENFMYNVNPSSPIVDSVSGAYMGGHAMAVVGYDDEKQAFKIQNSWGPNWGTWKDETDTSKGKGYLWISYEAINFNLSGLISGDPKNLFKLQIRSYPVFDKKTAQYNNHSTIKSISLDQNERIKGVKVISYDIKDNDGIDSIDFMIDNNLIYKESNHYTVKYDYYLNRTNYESTWKENRNFNFNTTNYADGIHTLSIKITDENGMIEQFDYTIKIVNNTPAMNIQNNSNIVLNTSTINFEDFESIPSEFGGSPYKDFNIEIQDIGGAALELLNNPNIQLTGNEDFSIIQYPNSTINPDAKSNLIIRFFPKNTGEKTATVTINSNDPDTPSFTFTVKGTGVVNWYFKDDSFTPPWHINADGIGDLGVRFVDVDHDGHEDMIYHRFLKGGVIQKGAFINTGSGWRRDDSFAPPWHIAADGIGALGVSFVDVDHDGYKDLIYHRWINGSIQKGAFINTGSGWRRDDSFAPPWHINADGIGDLGVRFVDVDHDGYEDMIYHRFLKGGVIQKGAFINTGSGWRRDDSFAPPWHIAADGIGALGVSFVDVDHDGYKDMIYHRFLSGGVIQKGAFINTGSGWRRDDSFAPPWHINADDIGDLGVRFVDVDHDGYEDMIYHRFLKGGVIQKGAFINTGSGWNRDDSFAPPWHIAADGIGALGVSFVDVDHDGYKDMIYHRFLSGGVIQKGAFRILSKWW